MSYKGNPDDISKWESFFKWVNGEDVITALWEKDRKKRMAGKRRKRKKDVSALAYLVTGEGSAPTSVSYTDTNGNTQPVDESWEETFPYGAFAFETSGLALSEGESGVIKVYRLGGTTGRATAYLTYEPVLLQDENGGAVYDYAVSANDVAIQVEEPLPRARYDAVGLLWLLSQNNRVQPVPL